MKNEAIDIEKKDNFKTTLTFFNSKLSNLNNTRMQLNRSKGMAKYFAKSYPAVVDLYPLDTTLGIMSFSLYILRFSSNLGLLIQLMNETTPDSNRSKVQRELYYSLFNDCFWSMVNLTEFFWLTFRKSQTAGLQGLQLEVIAQLIDIVIMLIRFSQEKQEFLAAYQQANEEEKTKLDCEWRYKEIQFMRSLITATAIALVLGSLAFSIASLPVSPMIFTVVLISSITRILIAVEKDQQLKQQHLNDLNQVILYNVFTPLGLFLILTTPPPLSFLSIVSMLLIHNLSSYLIDAKFAPPKQPEQSAEQLTMKI